MVEGIPDQSTTAAPDRGDDEIQQPGQPGYEPTSAPDGDNAEENKNEEVCQDRVESVTNLQDQQQPEGQAPTNTQTSSREVVQTTKGLVPKEAVRTIMQANIPPDAPAVKMISSNQSQEYFAVATQTGFEII